MANYTISGAIAMINGILDLYASEAQSYMKSYIESHAKNSTRTLSGSINIVRVSDSARSIGSDLDYAKYVNDGRGEVVRQKAKALHWEYPRPGGQDFFAQRVAPAKGMHFIEATKEHIETWMP